LGPAINHGANEKTFSTLSYKSVTYVRPVVDVRQWFFEFQLYPKRSLFIVFILDSDFNVPLCAALGRWRTDLPTIRMSNLVSEIASPQKSQAAP